MTFTFRCVLSDVLRHCDLHQLQREQLQSLEWEREPARLGAFKSIIGWGAVVAQRYA